MINYIEKSISYISEGINNCEKSYIHILYGDEGIGKSTTAIKYSEVYKNVLHFKCGTELDLARLVSTVNLKTDYDRHLHLFQPLIEMIKEKQTHTLLLDITPNTNEDFFDLINDIFNNLNQQGHFLNVVIFIDNGIYHQYQKAFAKYPRLNYLPPMKKWETYDFFQLWQEHYQENVPDNETLELIARYSIGNAKTFLEHLHTLKFFGILFVENNTWHFNKKANIEEILKEQYSDIVKKKYEALAPELQTAIKQTSTIGYVFQEKTLKEVFDIKNAQTALKQIELLTELLYFTDSEMENGKFDSEAVQLQIEDMISPDMLIVWCRALAEYYENKIKSTSLTSLERCALKEKSVVYYTKANNIEKMIFHYLTIIPLKFSLSQYNSALEMSKKLANITDGNSQYKWVYNYCFYMMAMINKSLTNYTEALSNLNTYILLIEKETTETTELKAELLYDIGDTTAAYGILKTLYKKINKIDDPNLKVSIISMLSSIEETVNKRVYIKHYNEALSIAKKHELHKEYYKLLRKANLAHSGENGIMLMQTAEKYFSCNNTKSELIMVQHNIGTEELFYETSHEFALEKLNSAYKMAQEIGFSQLTYISNSLAMHSILTNGYKSAVSILDHSLTFQHEDFTVITLLLNKATCLRNLELYDDALHCIKKAEKLNSKKENNFPFFTAQIIAQLAYLYLETKDYNNAFLLLQKYIDQDLDNRDTNVISAMIVLKELCKVQKFDYPPVIADFSDDYDSIAKRMADNHLVLCELMFWE